MKRTTFLCILIPFVMINLSGCTPLVVGMAAGGIGIYAVGRDTVEGETDKPYESLWGAALTVSKIRGQVKYEDTAKGIIELEAESSRVYIRLIRLTKAATRLRISARKYHLPNLSLAQDIFVKIMEQAG